MTSFYALLSFALICFSTPVAMGATHPDSTAGNAIDTAYSYLGKSTSKSMQLVDSLLDLPLIPLHKTKALRVIAISHQLMGEDLQALLHIKSADSCYQYHELQAPPLAVGIAVQHGSILTELGQLAKGRKALLRALDIARENQLAYFSAYVQKSIASQNYLLKKHEEAITFGREALSFYQHKLQLKRDLHYCYTVLGNAFQEKEQLDSAEKMQLLAVKTAHDIGDSTLINISKVNYANILKINEGQRKALEQYHQARNYFTSLGATQYLGPINVNIGISLQELQAYDEAIPYLQKGIKMCRNEHKLLFVINGFGGLSKIAKARGDSAAYYRYQFEIATAEYKLLEQQTNSRIEQIHDEYALHQKELENAQLKEENAHILGKVHWRNTVIISGAIAVALILMLLIRTYRLHQKAHKHKAILEQQHKTLARLDHKKDMLLSIISHDLRAPISQLIYLQEEMQQSNLDPAKYQKLGNSILNSTKNGLAMLDNILIWTNGFLKGEKQFKSVRLSECVETVLEQQKQNIDKKNLKVIEDFKPITITTDDQLVQIVVRNLVSNAIKFSPPASSLWINIYQKDTYACISIKDQGQGLPKKVVDSLQQGYSEKIQSFKGTLGEMGTGLGLRLSQDFATRIHGKIAVLDTGAQGTTMCFYIPLEPST